MDLAAATGDVLETAKALDLSVYDAAYLALAAFRGLPLATADEPLRTACLHAGIELVA